MARGIASGGFLRRPTERSPAAQVVEFVGAILNKVRRCHDLGLFIAATNVETGLARIFERDEISLEVVMASACLPLLFKAVEIDGGYYWDGGFMGNPPLFPFFDGTACDDIAIVQINPVYRQGVPQRAREILNRMNEITFNSALVHELELIEHVNKLVRAGELHPSRHRDMRFHVIEARKQMRPLGVSSKANSEWSFLRHLFDIGRDAASRWLDAHFDAIGRHSSVDISQMFRHQRRVGDGGAATTEPQPEPQPDPAVGRKRRPAPQ